jgi:vacuolar-type H+-ATPase subunit F/Vma7
VCVLFSGADRECHDRVAERLRGVNNMYVQTEDSKKINKIAESYNNMYVQTEDSKKINKIVESYLIASREVVVVIVL